MKRLEDAGAAAIVMYSLFEEQIVHDAAELNHFLTQGTESFAEAITYFPEADDYNLGPEEYVEHLHRAKGSLGIPVIGSLNGVSPGGWIKFAKKIEEAGADAIELNVYYIPTDPALTGIGGRGAVHRGSPRRKSTVKIPVAIKLNPFFSSMANMARRLDGAGADGLCCSTGSISPTSTWRRSKSPQRHTEHAPRDAASAPLGGHTAREITASIAATAASTRARTCSRC